MSATRPVLLSCCLALATPNTVLSQSDYAAPILAGISNQGQNMGEPYVTAGDRTYLIGTQDGNLIPLIEHIFGVQPDARNKTIVLDPHLPTGWEDIALEDLPVDSNVISFSRARTEKGIEYALESKENGWTFVLKGKALPGASYYLNGKAVAFTASGIRMSGRRNRLLISSPP